MINFKKLLEVPYIKDYSGSVQFKRHVGQWENIWRSMSDIGKYHSALIRAVECTNGCVQYAYREQQSFALPIEKTRECMKTSMRIINHKKINLKDGSIIEFDSSIHDVIDNVRDIYIAGFKNNDEEKLMEFYAQSLAHFFVLGPERIDDAFQVVANNFSGIFTIDFIERGRSYVYKYLNAIGSSENEESNSINPYIDLIIGGII
jgi:hypothetical protein